MEEFKPMLYEESVKPLNVADMAKVARNVKIPMATGERLYTRWGFRPFFEEQVLDVIQPDLCLAGGITEGKKICDFANIYDVSVQCHVCGGPVSVAAALQLETTIPNFIIHEHVGQATLEGNCELINQELQPKNGYFQAPDAPGLGIDLNEKAIAKYECVKVG
jgi:L-alanine-DL-glutamate epimerase-like enolase superfamily enzyme